MSKAEEMAQAGQMGREIPGDDLTADLDPLTHPAAEMDMADLEKLIDSEIKPQKQARDQSLDEFESPGLRDTVEDAPDQEEVPEQEEEVIEATEPEETAEEEPKEEAAAEPAEEVPAEEPAEPMSVTEHLESLERRLEISGLENERAKAQADRFKAQRDTSAGTSGALMQQVEELQRQMQGQQPREDSDYLADPTGPTTVTRPPDGMSELQQELQDIRSERVGRAITAEAESFRAETIDFFNDLNQSGGQESVQAFTARMQEHMARETQDVQEILYGKNPNVSAKIARSLIRTAFADTRIELLKSQEAEARQRSAAAKTATRSKKMDASVTRSRGGASTARKKGIDPYTAPLEDLEKSIDDEFDVDRGAGEEML